MPANTTGSVTTNHRRPGGVTRGRENRPQTPSGESHTPEPRSVEEGSQRADPTAVRKRRRMIASHPHCHPSTSNNPSHAHPKPNTRSQRDSAASAELDNSRKLKPKHRPTSDDVEMHVILETQTRGSGKARRAERSRSRDTSNRTSVKGISAQGSDEELQPDGKIYTGPLASADHTRLKSELDSWRKKAHSAEKRLNKRNEEVEKLRKELATLQQSDADRSSQLEKLRKQSKKSSEIISSIESHMSCNICMDLMLKPFGLSPCGHVLCQSCLQEWFRTAPANDGDMFDDDSPEALLYRKKSCPVCRANIRTRPIPLFIVKSIAAALEQSKPNATRRDSPAPQDPETSDPWAGIFLEHSEGDEGSSDEDESDEDGYDDYEDQWSSDNEYGSGSDDGFYAGDYIYPSWSPPSVHVTPFDYPFLDSMTSEELSMLRRGCTLGMIELFDMHYDHDIGLTADVDGNTIHLGWNVKLLSGDESGEEFIEWALRDIHDRPDRWEKIGSDDGFGHWEAFRLVPANEDREYETDEQDSDIWAAGIAAEDDFMDDF